VAVALCLVLEKIYRKCHRRSRRRHDRLLHLIIAHHLSLSGDTMEMMRAVLDSNFWLTRMCSRS